MGFEVNRQRDSSFGEQKPKLRLSKTGKAVLIAGAVLIVVIAIVIIATSSASKEEQTFKAAISGAVERSIAICRNSITELGLSSGESGKAENYIESIQKEKKLIKQSELAVEMLTYMLGLAGDNVAVQDDLKGAQNRIFVAVKEYQAKYGNKNV